MPQDIETIGQMAIERLSLKHAARELALPKARSAIRNCANSIRAVHRHEFSKAAELRLRAAELLAQIAHDLSEHQDIFYAGFVQDAQKEFAEAVTFSALSQHQPLPTPEELAIDDGPYLNGLAEAVGELRRYVLDQLRRGKFADSEIYLNYMDDIYALLTSIDFPDAITSGLRRSTDAARGILEKTRGDLTAAVGQARLQQSMQQLRHELERFQAKQ
jgi:translin